MKLDASVPTRGTGRVSSPPSETMAIYAAKHKVRSVTGGREPARVKTEDVAAGLTAFRGGLPGLRAEGLPSGVQ